MLRFILSVSALLFATSLLAISLFAGNVQRTFASGSLVGQREFYLAPEILPDHLAYPLLMIVDRVKLETSSPLEQIYLQVDYANRRLEYAEELLKKEKTDLAFTTLTKAQKYLLHASEQAVSQDTSDVTRTHVLKSLKYHQTKDEELRASFSDLQQTKINEFSDQAQVLIGKLSVK